MVAIVLQAFGPTSGWLDVEDLNKEPSFWILGSIQVWGLDRDDSVWNLRS